VTDVGHQRASVIAVLSAMALVVLDAGLLSVALPSLAQSLAVTPSSAILAVSTYQTTLVIGLLPVAHLADRLGYRRLFIGGLGLFSFASILCAVAPSLPFLVAARVLQGLGGAAIMALGIALLRFALGQDRLGTAIAWNALTVAMCSAAAPIVGALILSVAAWPWLFLAKLPISVLSLASARGLPRVESVRKPIDTAGIILHGATASLFLAAASMPGLPFAAALLAVTAIALAALFLRRERDQPAPLWPIDLLALRPFRVAAAASICCFAGQSAGLLGIVFQLQLGSGYGPLSTGLVMACWPLSVAATAPVAGRQAHRFGSASICAVGGGLLGAGLLLCALSPSQAMIITMAVGASLAGVGFGLFQVPNNRTLFLSAPPERSAASGGLQGSARLIGQASGSLLISLLLSCLPDALAARAGLALAALFAITAGGISTLELPAKRFFPSIITYLRRNLRSGLRRHPQTGD
jgi:DHA2 family multidrug resistance protein-like MFS transporter